MEVIVLLKFTNLLDIQVKSNMTKISNDLYIINNIHSLKTYLEKFFPEMSNLNLDVSVDTEEGRQIFEEEFDYGNKTFSNFLDCFGTNGFFVLRRTFMEGGPNKKGVFIFLSLFQYHARHEVFGKENNYEFHYNAAIETSLLDSDSFEIGVEEFKKMVCIKLEKEYPELFLIKRKKELLCE